MGKKPVADIGDIIQVKGYGDKDFVVYCVRVDYEIDAVDIYDEVSYDASCGDEHILAFQEDISFIKPTKPADIDYEYLEDLLTQRDSDYYDVMESLGLDGYETFLFDTSGMLDEMMGEYESMGLFKRQKGREEDVDKRKQRQSNDEKVDELLTELSDYLTLIEMVGEDYEEGDRYYAKKVEAIKERLKEC